MFNFQKEYVEGLVISKTPVYSYGIHCAQPDNPGIFSSMETSYKDPNRGFRCLHIVPPLQNQSNLKPESKEHSYEHYSTVLKPCSFPFVQRKVYANFSPADANFSTILAGEKFARKFDDYASFGVLGTNVDIST